MSFPEWGIDAVKVKVDTGARTSSLHAIGLKFFEKDSIPWVKFIVHPHQKTGADSIPVTAPVLSFKEVESSSGELPVVTRPIINVHSFLNRQRYLPDRRDLNRSFPGSAKGSLAAKIAHLFMSEVVSQCDIGIDLHTGSDDRANLPQLRSNLDDDETRKLCEIFGAPFMLHSKTRDGSLREAAGNLGKKVLLFEGEEGTTIRSYT